jgi:hypothetical protein
MITNLITLWKTEPARIIGFVGAVLTLLVSFGFQVTGAQQDSVIGVVTAILFLLGAEVTRSQVTPVE